MEIASKCVNSQLTDTVDYAKPERVDLDNHYVKVFGYGNISPISASEDEETKPSLDLDSDSPTEKTWRVKRSPESEDLDDKEKEGTEEDSGRLHSQPIEASANNRQAERKTRKTKRGRAGGRKKRPRIDYHKDHRGESHRSHEAGYRYAVNQMASMTDSPSVSHPFQPPPGSHSRRCDLRRHVSRFRGLISQIGAGFALLFLVMLLAVGLTGPWTAQRQETIAEVANRFYLTRRLKKALARTTYDTSLDVISLPDGYNCKAHCWLGAARTVAVWDTGACRNGIQKAYLEALLREPRTAGAVEEIIDVTPVLSPVPLLQSRRWRACG